MKAKEINRHNETYISEYVNVVIESFSVLTANPHNSTNLGDIM